MKVRVCGNDYDHLDDGKTHINIYSDAQTALGSFLSNFTWWPTHTQHGDFCSLEGYYHYLKCISAIVESTQVAELSLQYHDELEHLRTLHGVRAQNAGRDLRKRLRAAGVWFTNEPDALFRQWFKAAVKRKIDSSTFKEAFYETSLPFTHYYVYTGTVQHKAHYDWLSELINEIRYGD